MRRQVFACVDCDSFYVSCERVFAPRLARAPVIVLSNNDGCVISRSNEAKALGVPMGAPFFKVRALCEARGVKVFSSNYELYGDMSWRVMETLARFTPEIEIYSIDEAFIGLRAKATEELISTGREIRSTVLRWTGVPVSVGIAQTKTLAKLGATIAKRSEKAAGVVALLEARHVEYALASALVRDVWNVGPRIARRLTERGILTAQQLCDVDKSYLPRRTALAVRRIVCELRGTPCRPLALCQPTRKSVICSRSFGRPVEKLSELQEAVAYYVALAAEKLRRSKLAAGVLVVFVMTDRFNKRSYYSNSAAITLEVATDLTPELIRHAHRGLERSYREGFRYKKAGVMLLGLVPAARAQASMFDESDRERARRVMRAVDAVNERMGRDTLYYAATGNKRDWRMLCEQRSPCYTTRWGELLEIDV